MGPKFENLKVVFKFTQFSFFSHYSFINKRRSFEPGWEIFHFHQWGGGGVRLCKCERVCEWHLQTWCTRYKHRGNWRKPNVSREAPILHARIIKKQYFKLELARANYQSRELRYLLSGGEKKSGANSGSEQIFEMWYRSVLRDSWDKGWAGWITLQVQSCSLQQKKNEFETVFSTLRGHGCAEFLKTHKAFGFTYLGYFQIFCFFRRTKWTRDFNILLCVFKKRRTFSSERFREAKYVIYEVI